VIYRTVFGGVVDPDSDWLDREGQKLPIKIEKCLSISFFEVLDVLFLRAEGFSCSLDIRIRYSEVRIRILPYRSGSFYHPAKLVRKTLIPTVL
jgi:hypothetical protein